MRKERDISLIIGSLLIVFLFGLYGSIGMKQALAPTKTPDNMLDLLASSAANVNVPTVEAVETTADSTEFTPRQYSYTSPTYTPKPQVIAEQKATTDCAFGGCFEEHFAECKPDTKVLAENGVMLRMDILQKTPSGCVVKITYTQHPSVDFAKSELQCLVNNTKTYKDAISDAFSYAKQGSALCDGTMVALLRMN